jgi:CBS domain-containing protein
MKIRDILNQRNRPAITIGPEETVSEAIRKLNRFDRGALPVLDSQKELVGIISERDVIRKCFTEDGKFKDSPISEVMTRTVAIGTPDDNLDYAVSVMKQKRIRHLPVVEEGQVVGMVSMRDLLDVQLSEVEAEIRYIGLLPHRPAHPMV